MAFSATMLLKAEVLRSRRGRYVSSIWLRQMQLINDDRKAFIGERRKSNRYGDDLSQIIQFKKSR